MSRATPSRSALLACLLGSSVLATAASAVPITWQFTGDIVQTAGVGSGSPTSATTVTGSFSFESTTPDAQPGLPGTGSYDAGLLSFAVQVGGDSVVLVPNVLAVYNDTFLVTDVYDAILVSGGSGSINGIGGTANGQINIGSTDLSLFTTDALPTSPPALSASVGAVLILTVTDAQGDGYNLIAGLTSLSAVPEPSLGALLALSMLAAGTLGRESRASRRRRSARDR